MAKAKDANWFQGIVKIERTLTNAISWICTVWFAVMILCMVWQVVSRFILHISVPWTDEASRYLWITLCFIGAGAAISDNEHVEINIIASLLKKKEHNKKFALARLSDMVRYTIMLALAVFMTYLWVEFTMKAMKLGQLSAALMIPMVVPYIIIDIGMISVAVHSLFRLIISIVDHESIIDPQVLKGGEE
ncbi:MAG: TRAP transporter small permease [Anaerobutyricum sp.]|nr:TRAP transporter small permease [Anaerobutyricum sp.]